MIKEFEQLDTRDPNINWDAFIPLIKNLQSKQPKSFNMEQWFTDLDQLNNQEEFCGTACCIAGWVWAVDNREIINEAYEQAEQLHDLKSFAFSKDDIEDVIYERIRLHHKDLALGLTSVQVSEYARHKLGLTSSQAGQLFNCNYHDFDEDGEVTNVWFHNRKAIGLDLGRDGDEKEVRPSLDDIKLQHAIKLLAGLFMGECHFPDLLD